MLSNTSKYAIRAVIYLELFASKEKKAGIKEIAKELGIPSPFLGKILQTLARKQVLDSSKGPGGGFSLKKPAMDISLMEIVEIIDGPDVFDQCVIRTSSCDHENPCSLHEKISPYQRGIKSLMLTESIADLASEFRKGKEKIRI
jgi:Rrf2 family iron-sulfur cluster assembly transcriptional regulator